MACCPFSWECSSTGNNRMPTIHWMAIAEKMPTINIIKDRIFCSENHKDYNLKLTDTSCQVDILEIFGWQLWHLSCICIYSLDKRWREGRDKDGPNTHTQTQQLADCGYPITMIIAMSIVMSHFLILISGGEWSHYVAALAGSYEQSNALETFSSTHKQTATHGQ